MERRDRFVKIHSAEGGQESLVAYGEGQDKSTRLAEPEARQPGGGEAAGDASGNSRWTVGL